MKLLGFLNLRGISGQIAALVVASIVALHLIITASLSDPPAGPAGPVRSTAATASSPRQSQLARRGAGVRAAAAVRRHRARLSATRHREPRRRARARGRRTGRPGPARPASPSRQRLPDLRAGAGRRHPQDRHRAAGRRDDCPPTHAGPAATPPFWGGPVDDDAAVRRHQRHAARPVGRPRPDRAAVVLRQGRRKFQPRTAPRRRCPNAARRKSARSPRRSTGCASASPA